ncbi:MAG: serine hydrolase domain-containing protein [Gemmatimonadota bacterium]
MAIRIPGPFSLAVALVLAATASAFGQDPSRSRPEAAAMSSARLARMDTVMQAFVDSSRTAGIAILLLRDGRVVKSGAWGWADVEARRPLEMSSLFRIASQTKAVTSVAAMMLVEEGSLRLADPVHRWVPAFAEVMVASDSGSTPARRPITIRDLLTHTSGLSYGTESDVRQIYEAAGLGPAAGHGWYFADKDEPICTTMDRLGTLPLVAQPGERFVYGYSTDLLGCVIERVSGRTLDEFFRDRIFRPLRMNDTWFFVPAAQRPRLSVVYAAGRQGLQRAPEGATGQGAYVDGPRASYSGGAGLVSTIGDYARFLQMLLNGGELDGARILSPNSVSLMTADHLGATYTQPGLGFGLGFQIVEDPALAGRHGAPGAYGWGGAYATTYWVDPAERLVALIMTQTLPSGGLDVADRFRALVYSAITEPAGRRSLRQ